MLLTYYYRSLSNCGSLEFHVDRHETEDIRTLYSCPQPTPSTLLTVSEVNATLFQPNCPRYRPQAA